MTDLPPIELQSLEFELPARPARWRAKLSPVLAVLCVLAIFALHTYWNNQIAIAVLYVAVVLLAVNFCGRRGVIAIGFGCALLTVLSFLISDGPAYSANSIGRSAVSILAIAITTFLVIQIQAAALRTQNQARLLDLSHDAIFVRGMTDDIIYWNRGAEELYGWKSVDARGQISHRMLETEFPASAKRHSRLYCRMAAGRVNLFKLAGTGRKRLSQAAGLCRKTNEVRQRLSSKSTPI